MAKLITISEIKEKAGRYFGRPARYLEVYELGKESGPTVTETYYAVMDYNSADRTPYGRVIGIAHCIVPRDNSDCVLLFRSDFSRLPPDIIKQFVESSCCEGISERG